MIKVSVIIPCYNEQATIMELLKTLYAQDYPSEKMEVIIADGMSTDNTRGIVHEFKEKHPDFSVKVIDNPQRIIPAGLNRALDETRGEYIVRLDAHSCPAPDYISRSVQDLKEGKGDNIGGLLDIEPGAGTWMAKSIAIAAGHPLGVGDARYRIGSIARAVDTVAYGTFRSSLIDEIGPYDESLLTNEDYEFNVRLRQAGRTVWLNPAIRTSYVARSSLLELGKQYWRYGYWKLRMLLRYPNTFRWRQLSGAFLLSWIVLGVLSIPFKIARWFLLFETIVYGLALLISGIQTSLRKRDWRLLIGVPLAIATMHFSWGAGFLWSLVEYGVGRDGREDVDRERVSQ